MKMYLGKYAKLLTCCYKILIKKKSELKQKKQMTRKSVQFHSFHGGGFKLVYKFVLPSILAKVDNLYTVRLEFRQDDLLTRIRTDRVVYSTTTLPEVLKAIRLSPDERQHIVFVFMAWALFRKAYICDPRVSVI